jgi:hypothetical protein
MAPVSEYPHGRQMEKGKIEEWRRHHADVNDIHSGFYQPLQKTITQGRRAEAAVPAQSDFFCTMILVVRSDRQAELADGRFVQIIRHSPPDVIFSKNRWIQSRSSLPFFFRRSVTVRTA